MAPACRVAPTQASLADMTSRIARTAMGIGRRLALSLGAGAVSLSLSEFVFLNEGPVRAVLAGGGGAAVLAEFLLIYGGFAYVTLVVLGGFGVKGWAGLVLAGGIHGWLIEGVVIPLVYEAPPLSFLWPSLGWHMVVTFGVGWAALPALMRRTGAATQLAVYAAAGVAWAGWGRGFYAEDPAMILPDPLRFAGLAALTGLLLIGGRWVMDRPRIVFAPGRIDAGVAILLSVPLAVLTGWAAGAWALGLLAMVAATLWALSRLGGIPSAEPEPPPTAAYLRLAAFPATAAACLPFLPEAPAGWSFVVVLPLTALGTLAWTRAILRAIRAS
jgi:hypothetical protein